MLIPIGNSLRGCSVSGRATTLHLDPAAITLRVSCPRPHSFTCQRIAVAVRMSRPASLLTAQVAGHVVTLFPPEGPRYHLWLGYLWRAPTELSTNPVRVRVTTFSAGGAVAAITAYVPLGAGFG
jgi:hypothetical protein